MSIVALANRIAVTEIAYTHALERYAAAPTDANAFEVEAAAISKHFALIAVAD